MKTFGLALACAACACLYAAAPAAARAGDARATRTYIHAAYLYERDLYAQLGAMVTAVRSRANEIGAECPLALTYAPRDIVFAQLGEEASAEVDLAAVAPVRSVVLRLAHSIAALKWSDRTLTRRVRSRADGERLGATLVPPNVCSDIAAWRASAYTTEPPDTTRFAAESPEEEGEGEEVTIARLLRRYEGPAERRFARRVERLEARVERRMSALEDAARRQLASALGVTAL